MLKHTPDGHPDREGLLIAQRQTHTLAVQIDKSKKDAETAEEQDKLLSELEQLIEGCVDVGNAVKRNTSFIIMIFTKANFVTFALL